MPVLPARLAYSSLLPEPWREDVLYEQGGFEAALRHRLESLGETPPGLTKWARRFDWRLVAPEYDSQFASVGTR
jgi:hypothetical protein